MVSWLQARTSRLSVTDIESEIGTPTSSDDSPGVGSEDETTAAPESSNTASTDPGTAFQLRSDVVSAEQPLSELPEAEVCARDATSCRSVCALVHNCERLL